MDVAPYSSSYTSLFTDLKAGFEENNPGSTLSLRTVPLNNEEVILQAVRDAAIGQAPDVIFVDNNRLRFFSERGLACDMDPLMKEDPEWANIGVSESALDVGRFNGHVLGMPIGVTTPILAFNADLVKKAGGDPDHLPTTWDSVLALGKKIDKQTPNTVGAFYEWDNTGNYMYLALLNSLGGHPMTPDEKMVGFNDAKGLQSLEVLRSFGETGQGRVNMTRKQARQLFASGNLGILATSSALLASMEQQAGGRFAVRAADSLLFTATRMRTVGVAEGFRSPRDAVSRATCTKAGTALSEGSSVSPQIIR
ncbi:extracellular solute-binding protein [Phyllobacterium zundukense]|uniref:Extracellular solute-binding protein n=1 Tax=Phyllobacterium zundukense TaxID=1867719 RepID=A0ACD4CVB4_9HYPH|nr:extracellular solute-binding protein [Phyllobacterium zundukense]UXN57519.1 extracellular solute-binding protein [Phyllobacterium zundukense]